MSQVPIPGTFFNKVIHFTTEILFHWNLSVVPSFGLAIYLFLLFVTVDFRDDSNTCIMLILFNMIHFFHLF